MALRIPPPLSAAAISGINSLQTPATEPELLSFLLHHSDPRFYRVAVDENLFGEYSVVREWGKSGQTGRHGRVMLVWFSNLREAVQAADRWRRQAMRRGYHTTGVSA